MNEYSVEMMRAAHIPESLLWGVAPCGWQAQQFKEEMTMNENKERRTPAQVLGDPSASLTVEDLGRFRDLYPQARGLTERQLADQHGITADRVRYELESDARIRESAPRDEYEKWAAERRARISSGERWASMSRVSMAEEQKAEKARQLMFGNTPIVPAVVGWDEPLPPMSLDARGQYETVVVRGDQRVQVRNYGSTCVTEFTANDAADGFFGPSAANTLSAQRMAEKARRNALLSATTLPIPHFMFTLGPDGAVDISQLPDVKRVVMRGDQTIDVDKRRWAQIDDLIRECANANGKVRDRDGYIETLKQDLDAARSSGIHALGAVKAIQDSRLGIKPELSVGIQDMSGDDL